MTDPRARITAGELVVVLSRYDLGAIESVSRFRGGSRHSPKVLIVSERGKYLLKRRTAPPHASIAAHGQRVAFSHAVAERLSTVGFPIASLMKDRNGHSAVTIDEPAHIYELFRFIEGVRFDRQPQSAAEAGRLLAVFHGTLDGWTSTVPAPVGTFHNRAEFADQLRGARDRIDDIRARGVIRSLGEMYRQAAERAESLGATKAPDRLIHADWHPGNMIFHPSEGSARKESRIAGVVDLDSVRMGPRIADVANGALQFAALRTFSSSEDSAAGHEVGAASDAQSWRIALDPAVFAAFCAGYRGADWGALDGADQLPAVPWLMIEALIVEAVVPVAATGTFGRLDALPLLALVERTAGSIASESDRLVALARGR